jgi:putative ABC transport system ATP-binding protein
MIKFENVCKEYKANKTIVNGLLDINLEIQQGEFLAITGRSGAGKSTFLNLIGGLDQITRGKYYFQDKLLKQDSKSLARFRYENIGIIVQNYALINYKKVFDNIALPLVYKRKNIKEINEIVHRWAEYLEIKDKLNCFPNQLSGGECQRVAIARALCKNPSILLADEPTGALDYENKKIVLNILKELNQDGITILLSTHDYDMAKKTNRIITIETGQIINDSKI